MNAPPEAACSPEAPSFFLADERAGGSPPCVDSPRSETDTRREGSLELWFAREIQPHDQPLKAYLRRAFPDVRDVDDVVQESYLRLWRFREKERVTSARGFLFSVARRVAVDLLRRANASPVSGVADLTELAIPDERDETRRLAEGREGARLMAEAIARLPSRCREVFVLHKIRGASRRETAAALGISEKAVEVHTARAMERCGAWLRRSGGAELFDEKAI